MDISRNERGYFCDWSLVRVIAGSFRVSLSQGERTRIGESARILDAEWTVRFLFFFPFSPPFSRIVETNGNMNGERSMRFQLRPFSCDSISIISRETEREREKNPLCVRVATRRLQIIVRLYIVEKEGIYEIFHAKIENRLAKESLSIPLLFTRFLTISTIIQKSTIKSLQFRDPPSKLSPKKLKTEN